MIQVSSRYVYSILLYRQSTIFFIITTAVRYLPSPLHGSSVQFEAQHCLLRLLLPSPPCEQLHLFFISSFYLICSRPTRVCQHVRQSAIRLSPHQPPQPPRWLPLPLIRWTMMKTSTAMMVMTNPPALPPLPPPPLSQHPLVLPRPLSRPPNPRPQPLFLHLRLQQLKLPLPAPTLVDCTSPTI